jgi:hypothetical protein
VRVEVTKAFYARADRIWRPVAADWSSALSHDFSADELNLVLAFLRRTNEITRRHLDRLRG